LQEKDMPLMRERLPEPQAYYESQDLVLLGKGAWRTTRCAFHGGSDSMRVNIRSGAFVCMAGCGARGGDVLAYHMAAHGLAFVDAARALGAWEDDGNQFQRRRPTALPARDALAVLRADAMLIAVAAANLAAGVQLSEDDREALALATSRVELVASECEA